MSLRSFYIDSFKGLSLEIWYLSLISLVNRAGTMVLPFLSIYLTDELNFSYRLAGIALSIFGVGSLIGTYLGGKFSKRLGYYNIMFFSLFVGGLLFIPFLFVYSFELICISILFASIAGESYRPAMMASIALYSKPENRTRSIALIRLAINLGYALGPAIGGLIAYYLGYESLFIIDAITCISAAIILKVTLKNKTNKAQKEDEKNNDTSTSNPLSDPNFVVFLLALLIGSLCFMQLFYAAPVFYKQNMGLTENMIGVLLALNAMIVAAVEMPLIHGLQGRFNHKMFLMMGCVFLAVGFMFPFFETILMIIFFIIFLSLGEILLFPYSNELVINISGNRKAEYLAYYSMAFSVAHIFAPSFGLGLADWLGFNALWIASFGLCIISAILIYFSSHNLLKSSAL